MAISLMKKMLNIYESNKNILKRSTIFNFYNMADIVNLKGRPADEDMETHSDNIGESTDLCKITWKYLTKI